MYHLCMNKKKVVKKADKIIVKKQKGIDIDFADDSYSVYFLEGSEDDLYRETEALQEYELEDEMFQEAEFYEDD